MKISILFRNSSLSIKRDISNIHGKFIDKHSGDHDTKMIKKFNNFSISNKPEQSKTFHKKKLSHCQNYRYQKLINNVNEFKSNIEGPSSVS